MTLVRFDLSHYWHQSAARRLHSFEMNCYVSWNYLMLHVAFTWPEIFLLPWPDTFLISYYCEDYCPASTPRSKALATCVVRVALGIFSQLSALSVCKAHVAAYSHETFLYGRQRYQEFVNIPSSKSKSTGPIGEAQLVALLADLVLIVLEVINNLLSCIPHVEITAEGSQTGDLEQDPRCQQAALKINASIPYFQIDGLKHGFYQNRYGYSGIRSSWCFQSTSIPQTNPCILLEIYRKRPIADHWSIQPRG